MFIIMIIVMIVNHNHHNNHNKCIGGDTKAAARQSLNCIKNKKIWRKTIFNMADGLLHCAVWHMALES